MASSLISNHNSESFYQANLLNNTPNLVRVLVEDELDVVLWYRILKKYAPQYDFEISPYSYDSAYNGKGKGQILLQANQLGKYYIACVDSDFDRILRQYTADGATISNCPYILQTYGYSIENLAAQPYSIADCVISHYLHCSREVHTLDADYEYFIGEISNASYDVLLWHLVMAKEHVDMDEVAKGWDYIFGNDNYNDIVVDAGLSFKAKWQKIIARLRARATYRVQWYVNKYPVFVHERGRLEKELLAQYGLSQQNAYLYARGHNLFSFLIHCFFKPLLEKLKKDHHNDICAHTTRTDTQNAFNHYKTFCRQNFEIGFIFRNGLFLDGQNNTLATAIKADIEAIFKKATVTS